MELLKFIEGKEFDQIEEELSKPPFCIRVSEDGDLYLLKYSQIDSEFSNPIVRECRGIVLEKWNNKIVAYPFDKFFNYAEKYADAIDWNTSKITEKIDGSLFKLFYYNGWNVGTNGTIDAFKALTPIGKSFGDLFMEASLKQGLDFNALNPDITYIFELVGPYNKVVVTYPETKIYHIGARNNISLLELDLDVGIEKPKQYHMRTIEECIEIAKSLSFSSEGYVVVDANWKRVKVKSPAYVAAHHLVNNGCVTRLRILDLILQGETTEFVGYFPEYKKDIEEVEHKLNSYIQTIKEVYEKEIKQNINLDRKTFAQVATKYAYAYVFFALYDKKITQDDIEIFVRAVMPERLLQQINANKV